MNDHSLWCDHQGMIAVIPWYDEVNRVVAGWWLMIDVVTTVLSSSKWSSCWLWLMNDLSLWYKLSCCWLMIDDWYCYTVLLSGKWRYCWLWLMNDVKLWYDHQVSRVLVAGWWMLNDVILWYHQVNRVFAGQ
jgi:hypothetical protein